MGVKIECQGKEILDIKNITFEFLYLKMLEAIHEKNLMLSADLKRLIEALDLGGYGIGLDIAEYIQGKKDGKTFEIIIKIATDKLLHEFNTLPQDIKDNLKKFSDEITKYTHSLP